MFRSHEATKSPNGLENDDGYEFSGATLKISGDIDQQSKGVVADGKPTQSAILSGSDASTPIPPLGDNNLPSGSGLTESTTPIPVTTGTAKPKVGSPARFFSFRSGQFERAVDDCINVLLRPTNDADVIGSWLLTEVSHWDHEHERVYILTRKTLLQVKYDFISLRILQHEKIRLTQLDTIIKGKITYPQSSLVPRIEGITNGVASIISSSGSLFTKAEPQSNATCNLTVAPRFDFTSFRPVERNDFGVRLMWNKGQPISLLKSWNPFSSEIPWKTIKDHPLFGYEDPYNSPGIQDGIDKNRQNYSVENLYQALVRIFNEEKTLYARLADEPIMMENYVGIGAVIHNKNNFGFFKVRGKFSF